MGPFLLRKAPNAANAAMQTGFISPTTGQRWCVRGAALSHSSRHSRCRGSEAGGDGGRGAALRYIQRLYDLAAGG